MIKSMTGTQSNLQPAMMLVPGANLNAYIQSVSSIPVLSRDREQELADAYYYQENLEAARELIISHLRFVVHIARSYNGYGLAEADLIQEGDGILTNCFAEAGFVLALAFAKRDGKKFTVYIPETRPYLQGAKLTAPSLFEIGIEVVLITDNMPAHIMSEGKIQKFITAADLVTLDGHVVNKVGTFQNAIAAHAHSIPFFAFAWGRDDTKAGRDDIVVEERNPAEIRLALGKPTTLHSINARYPTFDITPPSYVSGIVTIHGVLSPNTLDNYPSW